MLLFVDGFMKTTEITAKSILRRYGRVDSWFVSFCGMNLYRGCAHNCAYCDGRAEKYRVEGEFGSEVSVKVNALEVLRRELAPKGRTPAKELFPELEKQAGGRARRARSYPGGFVCLGGGVGDSYQPAEEEYRLSRGALELMHELSLPVHVLTKSTLVLRDMDLLSSINGVSRAAVSFSICSADDEAASVFEPGVPSPTKRLEALSRLRGRDIPCGVFLLPVIPFVTDSPEMIESAVARAKAAGAEWIVFGGMTLKEGRQKEHFKKVLAARHPEDLERCLSLYDGRDTWGAAKKGYYESINGIFAAAAKRHRVPPRIPRRVFDGLLEGKALALVLLDHIHVMMEMAGRPSPFASAAYRLARMAEPLTDLNLLGAPAARAVRQILDSGTADLYEELLSQYLEPRGADRSGASAP